MRILIIPDIHLKPHIFDMAEAVPTNRYDAIGCLGDIADDWEADISDYEATYKRALNFAREHKNNIFWCYGNHDISYIFSHSHGIKLLESGYNYMATQITEFFLEQLKEILGDNLQVIHRIDSTLISHAGLTEKYARFIMDDVGGTIDDIIHKVNVQVNPKNIKDLWNEFSPIWARPQYDKRIRMYKDFCQIVGHTPVNRAFLDCNVLTLDTFSTDHQGIPIGDSTLYIVDTETFTYQAAI